MLQSNHVLIYSTSFTYELNRESIDATPKYDSNEVLYFVDKSVMAFHPSYVLWTENK